MTDGPRRRAAVLGSPVRHSLSPVLHRAAYRELGLDWRYDAYEVDEAALAGFLGNLGPEWAGLSLTMPLKEAVLASLDEVTDAAATLGAVNTVVLRGGRRLGSNTDVPGLVAALRSSGGGPPTSLTVLGGGATGRSTVAAAAALGAREVRVVVREPVRHTARLAGLATAFGMALEVTPWTEVGRALGAPVVVSTVPATAAAALVTELPTRPGLLLDVLYDPWPTPLAAAWERGGGAVLGGLALLVEQAALQVEAMTGRAIATDVLWAAVNQSRQA